MAGPTAAGTTCGRTCRLDGVGHIVQGFRNSLYLDEGSALERLRQQVEELARGEAEASTAILKYVEGSWADASRHLQPEVAKCVEWILCDVAEKSAEALLAVADEVEAIDANLGADHTADVELAEVDGNHAAGGVSVSDVRTQEVLAQIRTDIHAFRADGRAAKRPRVDL